MNPSPRDHSTRETLSGYLQDSGFSAGKKKTLVIWMIILWIAAVPILGFPVLIVLVFMSAYPPTFWEVVTFLTGPGIIAGILICIALSIQTHIRSAALKNRRRRSEGGAQMLGGQDYVLLSPWTSKKGVELHPVFTKDGGSNFIFIPPEKPPEILPRSTVEFNTEVAGAIE